MDQILLEVTVVKGEILNLIKNASDEIALKNVRETHLSKKSKFASLSRYFKDLNKEERAIFGEKINQAAKEIDLAFKNKHDELFFAAYQERLAKEKIDLSLPGINYQVGRLNPLRKVEDEILNIFVSMGYEVYEGPDIESDYYNFERMNIPSDHPAREMQDSFYFNPALLLRTHTSPAQARMMDAKKGEPFKVVCPGKCYRRDDDDATHSHQFMQIEGLVVGHHISLADLKGTLETFLKAIFGEKREIRLRGSYFPFTEPSVEVDISCAHCLGKGCSLCKDSGYIEILGAGMVHPNVLRMSGYNPQEYSGFAFGVGIDRVAMLKYGISDIRDLYQNDLRLFNNFYQER